MNNNHIQGRNSRFFTISSLRREPSPTRTLKWPGGNHVEITRNTSSAYRVQHVVLRATWYEGAAQLLSITELKSHSFVFYFIGWIINRWRRGGNRSTRRKPLATSSHTNVPPHILPPEPPSQHKLAKQGQIPIFPSFLWQSWHIPRKLPNIQEGWHSESTSEQQSFKFSLLYLITIFLPPVSNSMHTCN